jgi:hypothetical protein
MKNEKERTKKEVWFTTQKDMGAARPCLKPGWGWPKGVMLEVTLLSLLYS